MKQLLYKIEDARLNRCISIALAQKRFIRSSLLQTIAEHQLYPDLNQELVTAGVEAWRLGYDPDKNFKEIKNLTQRRLYAFLKANGFSRHWDPVTKKQGKGFFTREVCVLPEDYSPVKRIADATDFLDWCKNIVVQKAGREAWEGVMKWANSRQNELSQETKKTISILREVMKNDTHD